MDFGRTEEQELLVESVRDFITREFPEEYFKSCDKNHKYPIEFSKGLYDAGFGMLGLPEEYGGTPVDCMTQIMFSEEVARCTGTSFLTSYIITADDILTFGSDEQKKKIVDLMKEGRGAVGLGISEPQAGSDNAALASTATRRNGKVYINGQKTFCTNASEAEYMLCFTRDLNNPKPASAVTMWFLPLKNKKGVKIENIDKIGWNMRPSAEVYMSDVELEEKDIIGKENEGFFQLMKNFEIERLVICAGILGSAQAAYDDAVRYANQREQFGKTIGSFQLVQEMITDMAIKLHNMRNFLYMCAWQKDKNIPLKTTSALAKRYIARAGFEVADDAMQILGGIGYTTDHRVSRIWRDIRVGRIGAGTDQIMVHIAGRGLLKEAR